MAQEATGTTGLRRFLVSLTAPFSLWKGAGLVPRVQPPNQKDWLKTQDDNGGGCRIFAHDVRDMDIAKGFYTERLFGQWIT